MRLSVATGGNIIVNVWLEVGMLVDSPCNMGSGEDRWVLLTV
jgi:hypothetical protein